MRGLSFDRRVEALLAGRDDLAPIIRPMLAAWRQLREQIAAFDKEVRALAKKDPTCRLLMNVPGIGVVSVESMQNSGVHYDSTAFFSSAFAKQEPEYCLRRVSSSVWLRTVPE